MRKVHLQERVKVGLHLLAFENINMYSKGSYRLKLEAAVGELRCGVGRREQQGEGMGLAQQQTEHFSKDFTIRYQNEKIDLSDYVVVETPLFKYSKEAKLLLKLSLLKSQPSPTDPKKSHYSCLTTTVLQVRFLLNSICEYCECIFQEPFLSGVTLLLASLPVHITVETKSYKHAGEEELLLLKREVKRLRYNNYLMLNKFKKILYTPFTYQFTLPRMFVNGDRAMEEIDTSEEKFLNYLILYETAELTPEQMNYELLSIAHKNELLLAILGENCLKTTIFTNKLRLEYEEKESRKYKQFISREEYKEKYSEEYQNIIREKLKILKRELELGNNDETLNNLMIKMENIYEENKPHDLLNFPIVLHETERRKAGQQKEKEKEMDSDSPTFKTRFVFILAHGYQGCPEDLNLLANGFKRRFKKSKYLILKSYQSKMSQNIQQMAKYAVQEIKVYLNSMDNQSKPYKIVMIGHSMGGLILRAAAGQLQTHLKLLHCYISLGTPHLGYLQGIKFLIRAGISIFTNLYNTPCLDELSSKDQPQLHDCFMFKHSKSGSLANFKKVVLISSVNDKYVSWHSARLEIFSRDKLKQYNFIEKEMIDNILPRESCIERIDRIEVDFKLHENNMDKLLGRTSHIKLLNDLPFIELLANACLPHILEDSPN